MSQSSKPKKKTKKRENYASFHFPSTSTPPAINVIICQKNKKNLKIAQNF